MKYSAYMNDDFHTLARLKPPLQSTAFLEYCEKALDAYSRGVLSRREVGYAIAGTTFLPGVSNDATLEDITILASHVDVPLAVHGRQEQADKAWQVLLAAISVAARRYRE